MMDNDERIAPFIDRPTEPVPGGDRPSPPAGDGGPSLVDTETVASFLDKMAAREPAPGGGGACAVSLGMAAALVAMVARYSTRQLPDAEQLAERADALRAEVLPLVRADAAAYTALLAAFRDKSPGREERVAAAARRAAEVPLRMTDVAARVVQVAAGLAAGNKNLAGDLCTGAMMCLTAATSAAGLVDANVRSGGLDRQLSAVAHRNVDTLEATLSELDEVFKLFESKGDEGA